MKSSATILLTFLSLLYFSQKEENNLTKENLNGNVKYVIENSYSLTEKFGEYKKDNLINQFRFLYNEQGNFIFKSYKYIQDCFYDSNYLQL